MREPICAGTYYQPNDQLLKQEIDAAYHHERGPGALPTTKEDGKTIAIIAPNSPYAHCAPCAAWAFKAIAETPAPDLYILISANHHSAESGLTTETFLTPLGMARIDQEFARGLVAKGTVGYDDEIHRRDHGIEVQLPLLQHARQRSIENLKILPLLVSSDIDLRKLALDIKETLLEQKKRAIYIVSSDFLRYGPLFHFVPWLQETREKIREFDEHLIDLIRAQNAAGVENYLDKTFAPIDGALAIVLLLLLLKPCTVKFEHYYTSADILQEEKNSVSYAAIVFDEK